MLEWGGGTGMMEDGREKAREVAGASMPRRCKAARGYQAAYPESFVVRLGEALTAGEKDSEWPGWVWCTNRRGESRWVPEAYLQRLDEKRIALRNYDATELTIRTGENLVASAEVGGWIWCTNQEGRSGWVPADCLVAGLGEE